MKKEVLKQQVLTAMFTALICAGTLVVQIPTPVTNGYVNIGDCFVLAAAWVLGPWYGFFAGGVGSALADLISGYPHYIPGTFLIKGLMALAAALLVRTLSKRISKRAGRLVGALAAELIMVTGYFLYAWAILGKAVTAALTSIPSNLLQGAMGIVGGMMLAEVLERLPIFGRNHAVTTAGTAPDRSITSAGNLVMHSVICPHCNAKFEFRGTVGKCPYCEATYHDPSSDRSADQ